MRSARIAAVLDLGCVLLFVAIGRASHTKGESLAGIASTAWPFLVGLGAGWIAARAWRRPLAVAPAGLTVWLGTVALGMVLRVVSGQGTAVAFIVVALAFLGLFLLGWRLLARLAPRPGRRGGPAGDGTAGDGTAGSELAGDGLDGGGHRGRQAAGRAEGVAGVEAAGHLGDLG
ncbi:MAG TPA: DUF3054 domain-containing protein [Trebonia sp.]